jgi:hypothetical protein
MGNLPFGAEFSSGDLVEAGAKNSGMSVILKNLSCVSVERIEKKSTIFGRKFDPRDPQGNGPSSCEPCIRRSECPIFEVVKK